MAGRNLFDSSARGRNLLTPQSAKEDPGFIDKVRGLGEVGLTLATGAIAEPVAGIAGIVQSINPFAEEGAGERAVEGTQEALTFKPRSESGKEALQTTGKFLEPVGKALSATEKALGDFAFDVTGSPTAAAVAATLPAAMLELIGLKGLKALRPGTKLLDKGRPTKQLRKALDEHGLDFDSLSDNVKAAIPESVDPKLLPGANAPKSQAESVLAGQIKSGARDDALATLKVVGDNVRADKVGAKAVKQGFSPGFVQSVKTSSPQTKRSMKKMSNIMRTIKKSERAGLDMRPSDVIGDTVSDRIIFIKDKVNGARLELDDIARKTLPGKDIDTRPTLKVLEESLTDLDVSLVEGARGVPKADFVGSIISKDLSSQRVIRNLVDLLGEGGKPDALRFHKLKRQLDVIIDFNKKSSLGLSDAGKNVLKKVRAQLNNSLREVDPDYARVNDVMSQSLTALGGLDDAVGSIDIFGKGANKAIGQKMRTLMSNNQGRVKLENAIDGLIESTESLGGKFTDDIKDLVMFSDGLDSRFGTTAKTSFAGQVEQGTRQALQRTPKATVVEVGAKVVGKGVEKLRGVNEFNSFEALNELLK